MRVNTHRSCLVTMRTLLILLFFSLSVLGNVSAQSDTIRPYHNALVMQQNFGSRTVYYVKKGQRVKIKMLTGKMEKGYVSHVTDSTFTINSNVYTPAEIKYIQIVSTEQSKMVVGGFLMAVGAGLAGIGASAANNAPELDAALGLAGVVIGTGVMLGGAIVMLAPAGKYSIANHDFRILPLGENDEPIKPDNVLTVENDSIEELVDWRGEEQLPNALIIEPKRESQKKTQTKIIPVGKKVEVLTRSNRRIEGIIDKITVDSIYLGRRYVFALENLDEIRSQKARNAGYFFSGALVSAGLLQHAFSPSLESPDRRRTRWILSGVLVSGGVTVFILGNGKRTADKNIFKAGYVEGLESKTVTEN